jgi:hypothetical protein
LIPSPEDVEAFVSSGVRLIRLWPDWLSDSALTARLRRAGGELHVPVGRGTRAEVTLLMAHRPVSVFADDPSRLLQTLEELRSNC